MTSNAKSFILFVGGPQGVPEPERKIVMKGKNKDIRESRIKKKKKKIKNTKKKKEHQQKKKKKKN